MAALRWPFLLLDALVGSRPSPSSAAMWRWKWASARSSSSSRGLITGIAGGIMRDVLCNDVPLVFSSELYATVAIVSGYALLFRPRHAGVPHDMLVIGHHRCRLRVARRSPSCSSSRCRNSSTTRSCADALARNACSSSRHAGFNLQGASHALNGLPAKP